MKILSSDATLDGPGTMELVMEDNNDVWALFNIIKHGDIIGSIGLRNLIGATKKTQMHIDVTVNRVELDSAHDGTLRVMGRLLVTHNERKMPKHKTHSIDLAFKRKFKLTKELWTEQELNAIKKECMGFDKGEVCTVLMQEGLAHVCVLTQNATSVKRRIEMPIPRKRIGGSEYYAKGVQRFFEATYASLQNRLQTSIPRAIVLASPGFVANEFLAYVTQRCSKDANSAVSYALKSSISLVVQTTSGHIEALPDVLRHPSVSHLLSDFKCASNQVLLDLFFETLNTDPARAYYGPEHVAAAIDANAVSTLLISDTLLRDPNEAKREYYIELTKTVKLASGCVNIFSGLKSTGCELEAIGGLACILRYPMPGLDDIELD